MEARLVAIKSAYYSP